MTRNLKTAALSLFAVCALGALLAQSASATFVEHEFHADGERTNFTAKNLANKKIAVGAAGTVECTATTLEGTQKGTSVSGSTYKSDTITVSPHYTGCTFGGTAATVNFNHCSTILDSDTTDGNSDGGLHANIEVECAGGTEIEIDTGVCTITIGPQTIKHAVSYQNDTASSFTVKTTAKKIKVGKKKTTESQTGCLLFPTGEIGTATGEATYECFKDVGVPLEGTEKWTPTEKLIHGSTTECSVASV